MVVLSTILGGAKGLTGSLLGVALVAVFFAISITAVWRAAKVSPQAMMIAALTSFTVKILVLIFLSAKFSNTTAFNGKLFGLTAIVCVLVWTLRPGDLVDEAQGAVRGTGRGTVTRGAHLAPGRRIAARSSGHPPQPPR